MLTNKKAVIFDLDGTLIDSMWVWEAVDVLFEEKYNLKRPEHFHEHMEGMSFTEVAIYFQKVFELPMTIEEIQKEWFEMSLDKFKHEVMLKEGVVAFLEYLIKEGYKLGIATSSARPIIQVVLESHGIYHYFTSIVTSCEVNAGKPEPDVYLKVAEELGVNPLQCLVFEDVPKGVKAGKRANMTVCCVEDKGNVDSRLKLRKLSDYYIKNYYDVLNNTYEKL